MFLNAIILDSGVQFLSVESCMLYEYVEKLFIEICQTRMPVQAEVQAKTTTSPMRVKYFPSTE